MYTFEVLNNTLLDRRLTIELELVWIMEPVVKMLTDVERRLVVARFEMVVMRV